MLEFPLSLNEVTQTKNPNLLINLCVRSFEQPQGSLEHAKENLIHRKIR